MTLNDKSIAKKIMVKDEIGVARSVAAKVSGRIKTDLALVLINETVIANGKTKVLAQMVIKTKDATNRAGNQSARRNVTIEVKIDNNKNVRRSKRSDIRIRGNRISVFHSDRTRIAIIAGTTISGIKASSIEANTVTSNAQISSSNVDGTITASAANLGARVMVV